MLKDRPNKIPMPRTIARHYSEGRYCDYPTDILLDAVNTADLPYNPTAIPIRLGFRQIFAANFDAFVYLSDHRNPDEIRRFLDNPDSFMSEAGIELGVPFDEYSPKIFAAMVEDDMLDALKNSDDMAVCSLMYSKDKSSWRFRHPERYPKAYMSREYYWSLNTSVQTSLCVKDFEGYGFGKDLNIDVLFIIYHFSDND